MEISWTTLLLEIVNFLVLVWLLHRFLYRPVLAVIDRRRKAIEQTLTEAHTVREEARTLQAQYEHRLADWEAEKTKARLHLQEELDAERDRRHQVLHNELAAERERARVVEERRLRELTRHAEEQALELATRFSARLLERLASPHLEASLVEALLDDLARLPAPRREQLGQVLAGAEEPVRVDSAFALSGAQRERIAQALAGLAGHPVDCEFVQQEDLQAGLRVSLAHLVLSANLADELRYFYESGTEVGYEVRRGKDRAS